MKTLGLLTLITMLLASCVTDDTSSRLASGDGRYVVLDEGDRFWIVKIAKKDGPAAIENAATELRGAETSRAATPGSAPASTQQDPATGHVPPTVQEDLTTGRVSGRILLRGTGVANCKVKLTKVERNMGFLQWEETYQLEPTAITGATGRFVIRGVPPGAYRLKWAVPGSKYWVKRLKEKPDVFVEVAKESALADLDVNRRVR